MQRKGPLPGKMFAWCIPRQRFAGHFEYTESISCQNQLILDAWRRYLAREGRFYRPGLLWEYIRAIFCQNAALRLLGMRFEGASFRERALVCPKCVSKTLRLGAAGLWCALPLPRRPPRCGLWRRRCRSPGALPRVAGVGGGSTDRTEAEPFAAKRSETG